MRRVAFFGDLGSSQRTGGGYTFAAHCLRVLRALPVTLNAFSPYCPRVDDDKPNGTTRITLGNYGFGRAAVSVSWSLKLRREMKQLPRQDLYVFDQPIVTPYFLPPARNITMFHGSNFVRLGNLSLGRPRSSLAGLLWRKPVIGHLEKGYLKKKLGIPIFNSFYTLECLGRDFGIDTAPLRRYVTHLPVDTQLNIRDEKARRALRRKLQIADSEVLVVYISNFEPRNQPQKAAVIARRVLALHPEAKFVFVGRHSVSGVFAGLESAGGRCVLVPEAAPDEVRAYYSAADIAISTSREESFGYFLVEGMAASLPFVAYPGGAIGEIVKKDTGYLVNTEDDFVAALSALITNSRLRGEMGSRARATAVQHFSLEAFRRKFVTIANSEFGLDI